MQALQFVILSLLIALSVHSRAVKESKAAQLTQFVDGVNFERDTSNYTFFELLQAFEVLNSQDNAQNTTTSSYESMETYNVGKNFVILDLTKAEVREGDDLNGNNTSPTTVLPVASSSSDSSIEDIISEIVASDTPSTQKHTESTISGSIELSSQFLIILVCYILSF